MRVLIAGASGNLGQLTARHLLTRDIVRAGMISSVADNSRVKRDLVPHLAYPSLALEILR